jgi:hypothetical protein
MSTVLRAARALTLAMAVISLLTVDLALPVCGHTSQCLHQKTQTQKTVSSTFSSAAPHCARHQSAASCCAPHAFLSESAGETTRQCCYLSKQSKRPSEFLVVSSKTRAAELTAHPHRAFELLPPIPDFIIFSTAIRFPSVASVLDRKADLRI